MRRMREGLLGPSYFYHRRLVRRSKGWSPDEIRGYQVERLQRLVRRYGDAVTEKEDYRRDLGRYSRFAMPVLTRSVRTSGTAGQPLRFVADTFARRQKERAYLFDVWSQVGYSPYDLRVRYAGDVHAEVARYDWFENVWVISPGATGEEQLGRLRRWLKALPPFFLHVYPSSLYTFVDLLGEEVFRALPVRGVLAASEVFPVAEQLKFEQEFGINIAHWYGHSEYAVLAYCCRKCRCFHFYPTYGYVEFAPSEVEGCQRILASSFNRLGTQFVRYDTGDLAVNADGHCEVDNYPRCGAIAGRVQETFIDRWGRRRSLYGYAFGDLDHDAFYDQIKDIQFVQERAGYLRVRVVLQGAAQKDYVQRTLERHIPMASLEFEWVRAIERTPRGKRRYFEDRLQEGGDMQDGASSSLA